MAYINSLQGEALSAQCPQCQIKDTYRVAANIVDQPELVSICGLCIHYKYYKNFPLPWLNKKVIYLDQWCINNIGDMQARKEIDRKEEHENLYTNACSLVKNQCIFWYNHLLFAELAFSRAAAFFVIAFYMHW